MREQLRNAIAKVVKELTGQDIEPKLEHPSVEAHGDYSSNIAMAVFKKMSSPRRRGTRNIDIFLM